MHRIDSEGHENNRFVDEDANQAIAGTKTSADWLNAIQEELINILVLAGIDPLKAEDDQLAQAFELLGGSKEWADIENKPTEFPPSAHTQAWSTITSKPSTFPPEVHTHVHTHVWGDITDKPNISNNLSSNGYQRLSGGVIIQWGGVPDSATILFPITFPNACLTINATRNASGSTDNPPQISGITLSSFYVSQNCYWAAIGF